MNNRKIIGYDTQTGEPIYEKRKIIGYDTQTGEPIYEDANNIINKRPINNASLSKQQSNQIQNISNNQNYSNIPPINNFNQLSSNTSTPQKSNKLVSILVSALLIVLIIAVIVVTIILLDKKSNDNKNNRTVNEYENNTTITNDKQDNSTSDTILHNGFEFKKVSGYDYSIYDDSLNVVNDDYYMYITVSNVEYNLLQGQYEVLSETLKENGIVVTNYGSKIISGKEIMYFNVEQDGIKMLFFVTASSNSNYTFIGLMARLDVDITTDDLDEIIKVLNNSSYVGDSSTYSSDSKFSFDSDKIFK